MHIDGFADRLAKGAAAGAAGAATMQQLRRLSEAYFPETVPPTLRPPGAAVVDRAESVLPDAVRQRIPERAEHAADSSVGITYGAMLGSAYGVIAADRRRSPIAEGIALGIASWALGAMGWIPSPVTQPSIGEQQISQTLGEIGRHVISGIVVATVFDALAQRDTSPNTTANGNSQSSHPTTDRAVAVTPPVPT